MIENMTVAELVRYARPSMVNLSVKDAYEKGYDVIQPKYDGWWVLLDVQDHMVKVYSSGAENRFNIQLPGHSKHSGRSLIVAEWMYGTNWSQDPELVGKFFCHDILMLQGVDMTSKQYIERHNRLHGFLMGLQFPDIQILPTNLTRSQEMFKECWTSFVDQLGFEGLVFKRSTDAFGEPVARCKKSFTMDYVVVAVNEGGGRNIGKLGALQGGLYDSSGKLVSVCAVGGGFTDSMRQDFWERKEELIGQVFEASGMQIFPSGALRHPNFKKWRSDKPADLCKKPIGVTL